MWAGLTNENGAYYIENSDCFNFVQDVENILIKEESIRLDSLSRYTVGQLVKGGVTNWWKVREQFKEYEKSNVHRETLQKPSALKPTSINALLSDALLS